MVQQPDAARQQTLLSVLAANPRTEAEPRHAQPWRQAAPAKQQQAQAQQVSSKHTISLQKALNFKKMKPYNVDAVECICQVHTA